ncbi:hypothetical protein [Marinobacter sp. LQ44]|jgi:hypothetical protein|uniref:hypothetical protein n=1 Tax=Marinobacter TaxID=2742 RepID=UPI000B1CCE3E|nr:hypothetical protein [Marinobacter sp. LQ44]
MIDTSPYQHCECMRMGNQFAVCKSELSLEEKGKKVTLTPRRGEEAKAIVLDGCVLTDNNMKCDALYLFSGSGKKVAALVELKGAGDIRHAFEQLAYTRKRRPEYQLLKAALEKSAPGRLLEKAFIVTNGMLPKPEIEKLENAHGIRVSAVLQSEPSNKIPDLRDWF